MILNKWKKREKKSTYLTRQKVFNVLHTITVMKLPIILRVNI